MPDPERVQSMFARISGRYDLLNRLLSAGIDRRWRRASVRAAGDVRGKLVVDVCCGTGDSSVAFARAGARVVGVDFTREMLVHAGPKSTGDGAALFAHGDALHLPVRDAVADVAIVAFGIRNVADPDRGLAEMARVVRPGGKVIVLEFSPPPPGLFGRTYELYFTRILPRVGGLISGDAGAYTYLPDSVVAWPEPEAVRERMAAVGLENCGFDPLTGGIAALHWGEVPGGAA